MKESSMNNHWRSRRIDWKTAPVEYSFHLEDRAYEQAGIKRIVPSPDYTTLTPAVAEELFEDGWNTGAINFGNIPLPIINVEIFTKNHEYLIEDMIQPLQPWRDDAYFYGISVLFIAKQDRVVCLLTAHDCNDSSAGSTELAVVEMIQRDDGDFYSHPCFVNDEAETFISFSEIEQILLWSAFTWRGIQYRFLNKPTSVHVRHNRHSKETIEHTKAKREKNTRLVKVVRQITFEGEEPCTYASPDSGENKDGERKIDLECWGVTGHWRRYKSGRAIWIRPYVKGKHRDKLEPYAAKKYLLDVGGVPNA